MKKLSFLLLTLFLCGNFFSCEKEDIGIADENITISRHWVFSVYKTQADFFNYVEVDIDSTTGRPVYIWDPSKLDWNEFKIDNTTYSVRYRLKNGYVASTCIFTIGSFTNITFKEYFEMYEEKSLTEIGEILVKRAIYKNPFVEYYLNETTDITKSYTLGDINRMIEQGTLEQYFKRII